MFDLDLFHQALHILSRDRCIVCLLGVPLNKFNKFVLVFVSNQELTVFPRFFAVDFFDHWRSPYFKCSTRSICIPLNTRLRSEYCFYYDADQGKCSHGTNVPQMIPS